MIRLATAHLKQLPDSLSHKVVVVCMAAVFVLLAVSQLFAFEKFPDVLRALQLPGTEKSALPLATCIVALEVFSIPALIVIPLSRLMRIVSTACGGLVLTIWLLITAWSGVHMDSSNIGLLGAEVSLRASLSTILLLIFFAVLYVLAVRARTIQLTR